METLIKNRLHNLNNFLKDRTIMNRMDAETFQTVYIGAKMEYINLMTEQSVGDIIRQNNDVEGFNLLQSIEDNFTMFEMMQEYVFNVN